MSALLIYDSRFGNTEVLAKIICQNIPGCRTLNVTDASVKDIKSVSLFIVGTPTHGGRPSEKTGKFLNSLTPTSLRNTKVAAFDTRISYKDTTFLFKLLMKTIGYASPKLAKILEVKGGKLISEPQGFFVKGTKGPFSEGEMERAESWAKTLI